MYADRLDNIKRQIAELERQARNLEDEMTELKSVTPESFAKILHRMESGNDYIDKDAFYATPEWKEKQSGEWIRKASDLLTIAAEHNIPPSVIIDIRSIK
jgi:hypothetical protein